METRGRVLVVEDDQNIVDILRIHLEDVGLEVESAQTGSEGLELALRGEYPLIILDLMLPGVDGLSICRQIRAADRRTPILMLTARSEEMDKILGLEMGADDYITKPFSPRELIARVKALLRRSAESGPPESNTSIEIGDLVIDPDRHRVFVANRDVELTAKEFDLISLLASHPGQAFNREQLLEKVWHYRHDGYNHTVNSHINRLRAKVESDPADPRYILTVWGYGYRFAEPGEFDE